MESHQLSLPQRNSGSRREPWDASHFLPPLILPFLLIQCCSKPPQLVTIGQKQKLCCLTSQFKKSSKAFHCLGINLEFLSSSGVLICTLCSGSTDLSVPFSLKPQSSSLISCSGRPSLLSIVQWPWLGHSSRSGLKIIMPRGLWICPGVSLFFSVPTALHEGFHSGSFCNTGNKEVSMSYALILPVFLLWSLHQDYLWCLSKWRCLGSTQTHQITTPRGGGWLGHPEVWDSLVCELSPGRHHIWCTPWVSKAQYPTCNRPQQTSVNE